MGRYQVTGLPSAARVGLSAFMPHMNRLAASGAQQYKDGVTGRPGTVGIPIAVQARGPAPDTTAIAQMGRSRSGDAPPEIYPNQYWVLPERNYRPGLLVQMQDPTAPWLTTMVPVPAVSLRQAYQARSALLSGGVQPGGQKANNQPVSNLIAWAQRVTGNGQASG
jgi:hypothetical protein